MSSLWKLPQKLIIYYSYYDLLLHPYVVFLPTALFLTSYQHLSRICNLENATSWTEVGVTDMGRPCDSQTYYTYDFISTHYATSTRKPKAFRTMAHPGGSEFGTRTNSCTFILAHVGTSPLSTSALVTQQQKYHNRPCFARCGTSFLLQLVHRLTKIWIQSNCWRLKLETNRILRLSLRFISDSPSRNYSREYKENESREKTSFGYKTMLFRPIGAWKTGIFI